MEREWADAMVKSDVAAVERILAKQWAITTDRQVMSRAQALAEIKAGVYRLESMKLGDLSPHVFGDATIVTMTAVMKGKYKGSDIPGSVRSTDFLSSGMVAGRPSAPRTSPSSSAEAAALELPWRKCRWPLM